MRELWLQFINADSEEELEMINETNVPIMHKAVRVIYDLSEDTRIREAARLREKALHDEVSALNSARAKGRAEGRAEGLSEAADRLRAAGITEDEIRKLLFS